VADKTNTADIAIHQQVAEKIVAGLKKPTRDKVTIVPKNSYTAIATEDGWFARCTAKICEFNKKRISEEGLEKLGLHGDGAKPFHRAHHVAALLSLAGMEDGEARVAKESDLTGVGLEEMVAAFEVAAKPPKKEPAKNAATKGEQGKGGESK
jgi:hypothetical protein